MQYHIKHACTVPGPDGVELSRASADDELLDWDQNQNPQNTYKPEHQNHGGSLTQQLCTHFRLVFAAPEPVHCVRFIANVLLVLLVLVLVLLGSDSADRRVSLHLYCCCQRGRKRRRDTLQQRRIAVVGGDRHTNLTHVADSPPIRFVLSQCKLNWCITAISCVKTHTTPIISFIKSSIKLFMAWRM